MIVTDGGKGLLAALGMVYPRVLLQCCWVHKRRNVLNYVRKADWPLVTADLHKISHASGLKEAHHALCAFSRCCKNRYPKAVKCLMAACKSSCSTFFWSRIPRCGIGLRTTNAIERGFVEVRRRTRPMGVFSDRTSMERIMYAVFSYENVQKGTATPFLA